MRSSVARATARAASSSTGAGPARVSTDRLWSRSLCTSSRAGAPASEMAAKTSGSQPSLTFTTHSSNGGLIQGVSGTPRVSVAAGLQTGDPSASQDPAPLAFGGSTPHAVVHPVVEGVFQARALDGALGADAL